MLNSLVRPNIPYPEKSQQQQTFEDTSREDVVLNDLESARLNKSPLTTKNTSLSSFSSLDSSSPGNTLNSAPRQIQQPPSQQAQQPAPPAQQTMSKNPDFLSFLHNPFDINSYPVTNPPIFDSTMLLPITPDGVPRRRRISISNGQIGQIVNHEAYFEGDDVGNGSLDDDLHFISGNRFNEFEFTRPHSSTNVGDNGQLFFPSPPQQQQPQEVSSATPTLPTSNGVAPAIAVAPPQQSMQNQMQVIPPPAQVPAQQEQSKTQFAGVPPPNHQLIYNNEVIFNPNNGPIPGTAAWKKERLLERNRIAASKCRQRKKQAQMELQNNIDKLEAELKDRDLKIQKLQATLKVYNKVLLSHFENGDDISELKQVIEQSQSLLN